MKAVRVHDIEMVAINDLGDAETNARLMRYDTAHERCAGSVEVDDDQLVANGDRLEVFAERNPSVVPRGPLGVDFVLERTSRYTTCIRIAEFRYASINRLMPLPSCSIMVSLGGEADIE